MEAETGEGGMNRESQLSKPRFSWVDLVQITGLNFGGWFVLATSSAGDTGACIMAAISGFILLLCAAMCLVAWRHDQLLAAQDDEP
jgi:hypothetical protein